MKLANVVVSTKQIDNFTGELFVIPVWIGGNEELKSGVITSYSIHYTKLYDGMKTLFLLVGLVLVLEGLPYVAAPEAMQDWLKKISIVSPAVLRAVGRNNFV